MPPPDAQPRPTGILRAHWEVIGAAAILVTVLSVLDVLTLHQLDLLLSCAPLLLLVIAGLFRVGPVLLGGWTGAAILVALLKGDVRYAGLGYSAIALAALLLIQSQRRGPP
jgi:hypothetical protein